MKQELPCTLALLDVEVERLFAEYLARNINSCNMSFILGVRMSR